MKQYLSVVVKPTLFCDTDCRHCYHVPEERVPGTIPIETLDRLMRLVSEEYEAAWFIWHGGEPLTLPFSFYKKAIELEERHFGKNSFRYGNTIQTNGLNLNRRLMAFCRLKWAVEAKGVATRFPGRSFIVLIPESFLATRVSAAPMTSANQNTS